MPSITIIGFGSQGRAQAMNLCDSGWDVTVLLRPGSASITKAESAQLTVATDPVTTLRQSSLVALLIPDSAQPALWREYLEPCLPRGASVIFAHGYNIHYDTIVPRQDLRILLAGPMCPGEELRQRYLDERMIPIVTAGTRDTDYLAALTRGHYEEIPSTFKDETESDLFSEQALLCGGLSHLITAVYQTLVNAGFDRTLAYYTALQEPANLAKLFADYGLDDAFARISPTARYGALTRGPRVITEETKRVLHDILIEIQDGRFARELSAATEHPIPPWDKDLIAAPLPSKEYPS